MSQATKRKHVFKEVLGDYVTPTDNQQIVRVVGSPGNNLHEAATSEGERYLVSMPTKFRKNIWIKRGDFVIVDPIEEGDKVKGEISAILYRDHIHYLQKLGMWPEGFRENRLSEERKDGEQQKGEDKGEEEEECGDNSESEEDDSDLFVNTNRNNYHYTESEEDEDDDEDGDEDEEEEEEEGAEKSV